MTNEELQAHIKALNDAAGRGEIEMNISSAGWEPSFHKILTANAYRIKRQPREAWICFCGEVTVDATFNPPRDADMGAGHGWRKFREVTDE